MLNLSLFDIQNFLGLSAIKACAIGLPSANLEIISVGIIALWLSKEVTQVTWFGEVLDCTSETDLVTRLCIDKDGEGQPRKSGKGQFMRYVY